MLFANLYLNSYPRLVMILKDVIKSNYQQYAQSRCTDIFNKFLKFDDNKIMKIVMRLMDIYLLNKRKRKMSYFLKWIVQIEKMKIIMPNANKKGVSSLILHLEEYENNKEKGIRWINEYSRNLDKFSRSKSALVSKKNCISDLPKYISQIESFSVSREKNPLRLNSNNTPQCQKSKKQTKSGERNAISERSNRVRDNKGSAKLTKERKNNFFNSLYQCSNRFKENMRKLEMAKEKKVKEICTFKPILYKSKSNINLTSVPFISRLPDYEKNKKKKLNILKEGIESKRPKPRTKPPSTSRSKEDTITDLKMTSCDYSKYKKEKLRQMEKALYQEKGITFKPNLNDYKNSKVKDTIDIRNDNFIKMKDEKVNCYFSVEEDECTFSPTINMISSDQREDEISDVHIRLYNYKNIYAENKDNIKEKYEISYSFKHSISKNTKRILSNKSQRKINIKRNHQSDLKSISERQTQEQYEDKLSSIPIPYCNLSDQKSTRKTNTKIKLAVNPAKTNQLKMPIGNLSERSSEIGKIYISADNSLEKIKRYYKRKKYPIIKQNRIAKEDIDIKNKCCPKNKLMNKLDYYDYLN